MTTSRERIIETTCGLLEIQGFQATGLNQIIRESGAPKGSLYYYFPEGKEELIAEAVGRMAEVVAGRITSHLAEVDAPAEAVRTFILTLAHFVEASEFRSGGPITTAALEAAATSERVRIACLETYQAWQAAFMEKLVQNGCPKGRAARLATLIIASLEGAIILSRTERSIQPLEHTAQELGFLLETVHAENGAT
jgi:TetR/AcrR family transcriptional repressor of lmrAB and yxaGH operons